MNSTGNTASATETAETTEGATRRTPGAGTALAWLLTVCGGFLLVSVAVDLARGDGFGHATAAFGCLLLPYGLQRLAELRGDARLVDRTATAARAGLLLAAVSLWTGLIADWHAGRGTAWLHLVAAVFLLVAAVLAGLGAVAQHRSARTR